ncbi:hypothetical protein AVEN_88268-1 [Araneus ventricosus]|uniref:Uncharacterized protein n=1 Tax=Araneus ventricosus TaxID=182803 RepID=A0A4Y2EL93_ARAVE|nr:hypothetical protein AVEN_88268-1 [Araneus ventricosus]
MSQKWIILSKTEEQLLTETTKMMKQTALIENDTQNKINDDNYLRQGKLPEINIMAAPSNSSAIHHNEGQCCKNASKHLIQDKMNIRAVEIIYV